MYHGGLWCTMVFLRDHGGGDGVWTKTKTEMTLCLSLCCREAWHTMQISHVLQEHIEPAAMD